MCMFVFLGKRLIRLPETYRECHGGGVARDAMGKGALGLPHFVENLGNPGKELTMRPTVGKLL